MEQITLLLCRFSGFKRFGVFWASGMRKHDGEVDKNSPKINTELSINKQADLCGMSLLGHFYLTVFCTVKDAVQAEMGIHVARRWHGGIVSPQCSRDRHKISGEYLAPGVPCPVLGSALHEKHGASGESPMKVHEDGEGTAAPLL